MMSAKCQRMRAIALRMGRNKLEAVIIGSNSKKFTVKQMKEGGSYWREYGHNAVFMIKHQCAFMLIFIVQ